MTTNRRSNAPSTTGGGPAPPRPRRTLRQYAVLLGGGLLLGIGVALTIGAGLGVGSWQVFETGLMATTGAPFAVVAVAESVLVLVVAWIWLAQPPGPATVLLSLAVGPLIGWLLDTIPPPATGAVAVAHLAVGMVLIGVGVGSYIGAGLGASPQDSLFVGLFRRFGWRPRSVRLWTDVALVLAGWSLGGQVGAGTVVLTLGLPVVIEPALRAGARLAGVPDLVDHPGGGAGEVVAPVVAPGSPGLS